MNLGAFVEWKNVFEGKRRKTWGETSKAILNTALFFIPLHQKSETTSLTIKNQEI